jgi:16S rRNA (cytosine1402-N4)-methyltransferase
MTLAGAHDGDEPLVTAATIVNQWSEETLQTILRGYGEERYARQIAGAIVASRKEKPIETVGQLVAIIYAATPSRYHHGRIHPATRTFQALRIAANDELRALEEGLNAAFTRLASSGRLAVISFHSLEDRIVKRFFKEKALAGTATRITKKPIVPGEAEVAANRRSRSAKLRILCKL